MYCFFISKNLYYMCFVATKLYKTVKKTSIYNGVARSHTVSEFNQEKMSYSICSRSHRNQARQCEISTDPDSQISCLEFVHFSTYISLYIYLHERGVFSNHLRLFSVHTFVVGVAQTGNSLNFLNCFTSFGQFPLIFRDYPKWTA